MTNRSGEGDRNGAVRGRAVAQLPVHVAAPAPQALILGHGAGVVGARGDGLPGALQRLGRLSPVRGCAISQLP